METSSFFRKMEKVEKCVAEKVKKDCGSSAAKFQTRFVKHMFKPELAISCDQEPHGSGQSTSYFI